MAAINAEWILNGMGQRIYPVSHAKAAVRNNSTVDADLTALELAVKSLKSGFQNNYVITTRIRDPKKPRYGLGGEGEAAALDVSPYTGQTRIGVVINGINYDANNLSETGEGAKSGTLIIKQMEE